VIRLEQILLHRAAADSLAKANTDAAKMHCYDKREDRKALTGCNLRCEGVAGRPSSARIYFRDYFRW
jgi:hypothetical protein